MTQKQEVPISDEAAITTLIHRWAEAIQAGDLAAVLTDHSAGADVAFAHALLRCGMPDELAQHPDHRLRLTIGLQKLDGRWLVTHEHHSFPARD